MDCKEFFFESFNMSIETAYDAYFKIARKDILKGMSGNEDELHRYVTNQVLKWSGTPLSELGSKTPAEYLDTINTMKEILEMFREGAAICDDGLPELFLNKLHSFGTEAVEALLDICRDLSLLDGGEKSLMILLSAVQVLGEWKLSEALDTIIGLLDYTGDVRDLLYEKICTALVSVGKPAVDSIIKAIESRDPDSPQIEHLLSALADIACNSRSEAAYRCFKNTFLHMTNKSVGALCLGNYGDGRAIPALRGYMVKNRDNVDKETFFDVASAINRLGGNADDLTGQDD